MTRIWWAIILLAGSCVLWIWYRRETVCEGDGVVHLQSEHEHFHLHVDLPPEMDRAEFERDYHKRTISA